MSYLKLSIINPLTHAQRNARYFHMLMDALFEIGYHQSVDTYTEMHAFS